MDAKGMRRRLRAAADVLGIGTDFDYDRGAGCWEWRWVDGPAPARVAEQLGRELGEVAGQVRLARSLGPRAVAVGVVLRALGREDGGRADPSTAPGDPQRAPDERTGAMADALVAAAPDHAADDDWWLARHLAEIGGPAALLRPYTGTGDPLTMTAIEHLTHRYATRTGWQAAEAWRERLVVLDARTAALAALDDARPDAGSGEAADRATRLAAVALLGELRRELEALELAAMDAAVDAGASYTDLGRALGVARQVAHKRHRSRAADRPARLSPHS